ncbi:carbohydrate-binding family 9-like protein [Emticicia fluvialis]|uniref:carbohydrate-binding family 9-like protein n=1 Tax=Emticicia fluvialis TaxID=2974474 RepID=UPI00216630EB|nr:carbohydrate-binding family 9-like protein [Emticicia fluvialis]
MFHILYSFILLMIMPTPDYSVSLSKNEWKDLDSKYFRHSTTGQTATQETLVKLKYDDQYLYIAFECHQNPYWKENTYQVHNTEMYNQEVFEVFIAEGTEVPERYLELEINPNNVLWIGKIHNPTKGHGGGNSTEMIDYAKAGIKHSVKTQDDTWSGTLQIPLSLIGSGNTKDYRANFYRIVSTQSHKKGDWKCNPKECDFLCWSPTMSGKTPAFHRPEYFGSLHFK